MHSSSSRRIVALPVDARPVVRAQVQELAALAEWQLVMPPIEMLGHFRDAADRDALAAWLQAESLDARGVVVSIDMLVYGGLVPSRFIADSLVQLERYLDALVALHEQSPLMPIYAFAATMRLSNNNVNEEEKPYWNQYGELIWRWSFFSDRADVLGNADDQQIADAAASAIPDDIRADYLSTRARNFALTQRVLDLVETGVITRLILPQDDTAEYGFNIAERRMLETAILARGLSQRALIYPGADEVMHTLVARMVATLMSSPPLKAYLSYADPVHVKSLRALYEDRPIIESIQSQLGAVGVAMVESEHEADVVIGVFTSGAAQGDWAMRKVLHDPQPVSSAWIESLRVQLAQGRRVAILDLSHANGGDPRLVSALAFAMQPKTLTALNAYAGWNTASNTIGSLAAQCVLFQIGHALNPDATDSHNEKIVTRRLLEDYLYQAVMRQRIRDVIDEPAMLAAVLNETVAAMFIPEANDWLAAHGMADRVVSIKLPWQRTFEIDIVLNGDAEGDSIVAQALRRAHDHA
jgi:Protein of unknown function (DUF4127)